MGTATKIEWADHTASPWYGCQHAELPGGGSHPGCLNCYAEAMSKRNPGTLGVWGPAGVRFVSKSFRNACKRFQQQAVKQGRRYSVFPSLCDPFEDWAGNLHFTEKNDQGETESTVAWWRHDIGVCRAGETTVDHTRSERLATMADCRSDLFRSIDKCPQLDFMLLTKRPQNVRRMWCSHINTDSNPPSQLHRDNVKLLYSASDQPSFDDGIGFLLSCSDLVPVIGLSMEPLLGPVNISEFTGLELASPAEVAAMRSAFGANRLPDNSMNAQWEREILAANKRKWVIVGGESGSGARPCDLVWIRSIVAQCRAAGVPCFVKQFGENAFDSAAWEEGNEFTSYIQWQHKAGSWLGGVSGAGFRYKKPEKVVCTDALGRICKTGKDFMRADADNSFPVKWHYPLDLKDKKGGDWDEWPADLRVREMPKVEVTRA